MSCHHFRTGTDVMKGSDNFNNYGREYWIMCATSRTIITLSQY
ncbi:hypothetical protein STM14_2705 [Salmonella enterica subsp. enterica serovar Typhimurium str. 14028S]|uniref:Uncharacterized protein n=1 Tax=Salmonella typhimurium (strain 14028s / SGSC 2262) TaxID=588858 RepID=A0A0F6B3Q8_SALT1|nr:hypothetical protein STM14_2705 [Salmonella enterica subsp. enterica serovar Typhimurium str. 14028S]